MMTATGMETKTSSPKKLLEERSAKLIYIQQPTKAVRLPIAEWHLYVNSKISCVPSLVETKELDLP